MGDLYRLEHMGINDKEKAPGIMTLGETFIGYMYYVEECSSCPQQRDKMFIFQEVCQSVWFYIVSL